MAAVPRVTEILKGAGLVDATWFNPEATARGTMVHLACRLWDEGDLDLTTVPGVIATYLSAYMAWEAESPQSFVWIENQIIGPAYRGTPDRVGLAAVWDIKTGAPQPWHALQLAAYVSLLPDPYKYSRFGIYLRDSGGYGIKEYPKADYQRDLNVFLSALNLYNWRCKYEQSTDQAGREDGGSGPAGQ